MPMDRGFLRKIVRHFNCDVLPFFKSEYRPWRSPIVPNPLFREITRINRYRVNG